MELVSFADSFDGAQWLVVDRTNAAIVDLTEGERGQQAAGEFALERRGVASAAEREVVEVEEGHARGGPRGRSSR